VGDEWSLALAAPGREIAVSRRLDRRSLDNYVFQIRRRFIRDGQVATKLVPAFPGYIFVAARSCWDVVRDVVDVFGFVRLNGMIAQVPSGVVDDLVREADVDGVLPLEVDDVPQFTSGTRVRILAGPAIGYLATFVRMISSDRALILVDKQVQVSIPVDRIERVDARRRRRRRGRRRWTEGSAPLAA
jgi:transcriptional antiterminator RfaH